MTCRYAHGREAGNGGRRIPPAERGGGEIRGQEERSSNIQERELHAPAEVTWGGGIGDDKNAGEGGRERLEARKGWGTSGVVRPIP